MQLDMHFYGVYALARAAGIKDETARTIAYASQFVDDAIDDKHVILSNNQAILPTMTSHIPLDFQNALPGDQWKVWVPFHFLPGNVPDSGAHTERMVCRKNSVPAQKMTEHALGQKDKDYQPHLIGIAAHVYADTFSHDGFIGFSDEWNRVKYDSITTSSEHSASIISYAKAKLNEFKARVIGTFAEAVPLAHGAVATLPDRPYLRWGFEYETHSTGKEDKDRKNFDRFFKGCECLFEFFSKFAAQDPDEKDASGKGWDTIADDVKTLLKYEAPKEERIDRWKEALSADTFCKATDVDKGICYIKGLWRPRRAEYQCGAGGNLTQTDACKYIRAAWHHRNYVLNDLLPEMGLLVQAKA